MTTTASPTAPIDAHELPALRVGDHVRINGKTGLFLGWQPRPAHLDVLAGAVLIEEQVEVLHAPAGEWVARLSSPDDPATAVALRRALGFVAAYGVAAETKRAAGERFLATLWADMHEASYDHELCSVYDTFVLEHDGPPRTRTFSCTVRFSAEVTLSVTKEGLDTPTSDDFDEDDILRALASEEPPTLENIEVEEVPYYDEEN